LGVFAKIEILKERVKLSRRQIVQILNEGKLANIQIVISFGERYPKDSY